MSRNFTQKLDIVNSSLKTSQSLHLYIQLGVIFAAYGLLFMAIYAFFLIFVPHIFLLIKYSRTFRTVNAASHAMSNRLLDKNGFAFVVLIHLDSFSKN